MGSLIEARRRILLGSPHIEESTTGSFKTDMAVPFKSVQGSGTIYHTGKNMLPFDLTAVKGKNTNKVWDGNTFTNSNWGFSGECLFDSAGRLTGIVCSKSNTTATATLDIPIDASLYGKTVIISGCPAGGAAGTYRVMLQAFAPSSSVIAREYGSGVQATIPTGYTDIRFRIAVTGIYSDLLFRPMLTVVDDDLTFEPYKAGDGMRALKGRNNLWTDSGSVTVKFWTH